mmetsp:Transcript_16893/g.40478  ORF Transcript_16893/g.40478 Transcript_16893/m.40478 type:complete len:243 (-) Transcript_16893:1382-2110(-)
MGLHSTALPLPCSSHLSSPDSDPPRRHRDSICEAPFGTRPVDALVTGARSRMEPRLRLHPLPQGFQPCWKGVGRAPLAAAGGRWGRAQGGAWRSPCASSDTQKSGLQRRLRHRHSGDARTLHREVGVQPFLCLLCLAGARCRRPWSLDVATPGSWREKVSESFPASTEEGFQPLKVIARPAQRGLGRSGRAAGDARPAHPKQPLQPALSPPRSSKTGIAPLPLCCPARCLSVTRRRVLGSAE